MGQDQGDTGWVAWPVAGQNDLVASGEGGMWAYAFWLADFTRPQTVPLFPLDPDNPLPEEMLTILRDPFVACAGPGAVIKLAAPPGRVVSDNEDVVYPPDRAAQPPDWVKGRAVERDEWIRYSLDAGADLLAAVCLGTTPTALVDKQTGRAWQATREDLTDRGLAILLILRQLYGREPELVTYVDA